MEKSEVVMKICITGASGMLGYTLATHFAEIHDVLGLYNKHKPISNNGIFVSVDLRNTEKFRNVIKRFNPDIIIHCAAITDVDYCEVNKKHAKEINEKTTRKVMEISKEISAKMIFISTDSVFDGQNGNYNETSQLNPLNYYANTKKNAEEIIRHNLDDYIIFRTNIFGKKNDGKLSLAQWILYNANEHHKVMLFEDVIFNPLHVSSLSTIIEQSISLNLRGTYHIGSKESLSKLEFGKKLITINKIKDILITPITLNDIDFKAKRPQNSSLNVGKIELEGIYMPSIDEEIEKY